MMLVHWHFNAILLAVGPLSIHWYGVLFIAAFLTGQTMLARIFAGEGVPREMQEDG
jgi:prolipoprotein diacylglyceryltransferase